MAYYSENQPLTVKISNMPPPGWSLDTLPAKALQCNLLRLTGTTCQLSPSAENSVEITPIMPGHNAT
ncbi:hypothetical protein PG993_000258 [Apiospora rasikravindrae]|uniref:Uncharacterized protein n=1 Tax=Apiospora rasikravindrae TaxID=990691 RepID=A0ABR1U7Z6_9PEZI